MANVVCDDADPNKIYVLVDMLGLACSSLSFQGKEAIYQLLKSQSFQAMPRIWAHIGPGPYGWVDMETKLELLQVSPSGLR